MPLDPRLADGMIDLKEHYNASFVATKEPGADSGNYWLGRLEDLYEAGDGPEFDIRGKIQLNSGRYPDDSRGNIAGKDVNEQAGLKQITHLDFESAGKQAAPFLVGITLE